MSIVNKVLKGYTSIPLWVTNAVAPFYYCVPKSIRYGKVFKQETARLKKMESLTPAEMEAFRNEMFIKLVRHSYDNVPYYHKLFDEYGVSVQSIKDERDIVLIPFLTKELLVQNRDELIARNIDRTTLSYITTSGSTGTPVGFYVDEDSAMKEWAYTVHLWGRVGYKPDSSKLVLRGKVFWGQKKHGNSWQYDAFKRELSCNIFDLTEENMEEYCKAIEKYKPEFAYGYMSALYVLCKYIEHRSGGLRHQFKAALAISETVLDMQREYIERVLNTRMYSYYGHSERLVIAGECEYSTEYHVEPLYGIAEIVDENGNQIIAHQEGELVATGFCNKGMPMLRYKTGDIASWSEKENCSCGRWHIRLSGVHGRWKQDVLVNRDGAQVSLTAINMHSDVLDRVTRYQLYQDTIGKVILKIVPNAGFSDIDIAKILAQLNQKTQGKIEYNILIVESIPVNANGKYSIVNQRLDVGIFRI